MCLYRGKQIAGQIKALEAQLRALQSAAADIEDKRARVAQQSRLAGAKSGGGRAALPASHYTDQLEIVDALASLVDPSHAGALAPEAAAHVASLAASAPIDYLVTGQSYLSLVGQHFDQIPSKLAFARQRIAQAEKMSKLGAAAGEQLLSNALKQKDEAEKLLADVMRSADDMLHTASGLVNNVYTRYQSIVGFAGAHADAVSAQLKVFSDLYADIRRKHEQLTAPLPAAAAAAAAAPAAPALAAAPAPRPAAAPAANGSSAAAAASDSPAGGKAAAAAPRPRSAKPAAASSVPAPAAAKPAAASPAQPVAAAAPAPKPATAAAPAPAAPAPAAAAAPAPAPKPAPSTRQWNKVEQVAPPSSDPTLPTPAEAAAAAASSAEDGFKPASAKRKERKKA